MPSLIFVGKAGTLPLVCALIANIRSDRNQQHSSLPAYSINNDEEKFDNTDTKTSEAN